MARPKQYTDGVKTAFVEKGEKELVKLKKKLYSLLKQDILKLLEDKTHADVLFTPGKGQVVAVHSAILRARLPESYIHEYISQSNTEIMLSHICEDELKAIFRSIYTDENPVSAGEKLVKIIRKYSDDVAEKKDKDGMEKESTKDNFKALGNDKMSIKADIRLSNKNGIVEENSLGEDILTLWEDGKHDVILTAGEQQLKAHRCILSVRSEYFAAMLGGAWKESEQQEISLSGFSSLTLEKFLTVVYGGMVDFDEEEGYGQVTELLMAADMYSLEPLKEVISYHLRKNSCHFFHKPCQGCVSGVLNVLPIATTYGMTALADRCISWTNKHFVRTWPTKQFALLPEELRDKFLERAVETLNKSTVLDIVIECDRLKGSMPQVKWIDPVIVMATQFTDACIACLQQNFQVVVHAPKFNSLGKTMALGLSFLQDVFDKVIVGMPVDNGCTTYIACDRLKEMADDPDCSWTDDFKTFIRNMHKKCQAYMTLHINQVISSEGWSLLSTEAQKSVQEQEGVWYVMGSSPNKKISAPPSLSSGPKGKQVPFDPGAKRGAPATRPSSITPVGTAAKPRQTLHSSVTTLRMRPPHARDRPNSATQSSTSRNRTVKQPIKSGHNKKLSNLPGASKTLSEAPCATKLPAIVVTPNSENKTDDRDMQGLCAELHVLSPSLSSESVSSQSPGSQYSSDSAWSQLGSSRTLTNNNQNVHDLSEEKQSDPAHVLPIVKQPEPVNHKVVLVPVFEVTCKVDDSENNKESW